MTQAASISDILDDVETLVYDPVSNGDMLEDE